MGYLRTICILALTSITTARGLRPHNHEAVDLNVRRQDATPAAVVATTSQASGIATIFPSPNASPVIVTEESQLVTIYVAQFTLCELPPLAFFTATTAAASTATGAPYANYSISTPSGDGTCTTIYSPTLTQVCATTLSDLTTSYFITKCEQDVTFSTQYGYSLVTGTPTVPSGVSSTSGISLITPAPSIQTLTTYYIAPWQDLTSAGPPGDVDYKICTEFENGTESCILEYYQWKTSLLTISSTITTSINITTTVPGPSQLVIETWTANVTGVVTTFSMSTTMELETSTLSETTIMTPKPSSTESTVYQTVTLEYASSSYTTSTTTMHLTRTTTAGTQTVTLTRSDSSSGSLSTSAPSTSD